MMDSGVFINLYKHRHCEARRAVAIHTIGMDYFAALAMTK
jgi:hypothetical protein